MDDFNSRKILKYVDPDTLPQFDQLMESEEGVELVKAVLHQSRLAQNVMSIGEFQKYIPLFQYSGKDQMSEEAYSDLSWEYTNRICRFDPVYIVGDENEVLFTLPPVFNRTNPINAAGHTGAQYAQAFINACMLPDEVSNEKRAKYSAFYKQLFDIAQDNQEHERHKQVAAEMADNTLTTLKQQAESEESASEIESLDLKDSAHSTSNTNEVMPFGDDDEVSYM